MGLSTAAVAPKHTVLTAPSSVLTAPPLVLTAPSSVLTAPPSVLTAPSSHVVVATVQDGVVGTSLSPPSSPHPPKRLSQKQKEHVEQIASHDDSITKMPTATKCFLFLLLFVGIVVLGPTLELLIFHR
jgi:hypothetical protein